MMLSRGLWRLAEVGLCALSLLVAGATFGQNAGSKPRIRVNPRDGAETILVTAGYFLMGSSDSDRAALRQEQPQQIVFLRGYYIYKNPVTVSQYRVFCKATGREMPDPPIWAGVDSHPMTWVSWDDAHSYAQWAGGSLPTEAQWEKAARATDGRIYPWGNRWAPGKCNNMVDYKPTKDDHRILQPASIGSFPSGDSPYGVQDMVGSVWQWCSDWYDPEYYKNAPAREPTGPASGCYRVLRGPSWDHRRPSDFRVADRNFAVPSTKSPSYGFRCVVTVSEE